MPVVHRQHDGDDAHFNQCGIGNVIAQKRAKLFQDKTLHSQVPVAGTFFFLPHDTRLQSGR